jgi:hypothetical protein
MVGGGTDKSTTHQNDSDLQLSGKSRTQINKVQWGKKFQQGIL